MAHPGDIQDGLSKPGFTIQIFPRDLRLRFYVGREVGNYEIRIMNQQPVGNRSKQAGLPGAETVRGERLEHSSKTGVTLVIFSGRIADVHAQIINAFGRQTEDVDIYRPDRLANLDVASIQSPDR